MEATTVARSGNTGNAPPCLQAQLAMKTFSVHFSFPLPFHKRMITIPFAGGSVDCPPRISQRVKLHRGRLSGADVFVVLRIWGAHLLLNTVSSRTMSKTESGELVLSIPTRGFSFHKPVRAEKYEADRPLPQECTRACCQGCPQATRSQMLCAS